MRAWFYPGDNFGQELRYPKQLAMLQAPQPAALVTPAPEPAPAEPAPQQPAPQAQAQEPFQQEKPVELAQNTPPAAPAEAPPAAPAEPQPQTLPHTASPYPGIGLAGLLSLCLYGLLRLTRPAGDS